MADVAAAEAEKLAANGDFLGAATKFAEASREDPSRPELFCNIGIAYYKAEDIARAHLWLGRCTERAALTLEQAGAIRGALTEIEGKLRAGKFAQVRIVPNPRNAAIVVREWGPDVAFVDERTIWFAHGTYQLEASAPGHERATKALVVDAAPAAAVEITLQPTPIVVPPPPAAAKKRFAPPIVFPIATSAGTVGLAALALVAYGAAHDRADRSRLAISDRIFAADKSAISRWNFTFVASTVLATVGATASVYLWWRFSKRAPKTEVGLSGSGVTLRARF
jgi:hypothetical protein